MVLAAPNAMGHMNNEEFVLAITRYFGQQNFIPIDEGALLWQEGRSGRRYCVELVLRVPPGWRLPGPPRPGEDTHHRVLLTCRSPLADLMARDSLYY